MLLQGSNCMACSSCSGNGRCRYCNGTGYVGGIARAGNAEPVRYQVNAAGAEAQVVDHPWRVPTQGYSFG